MSIVFFTGFPGFLGSNLLPRILARSETSSAVCLVQAKFADLARRRVDELVAGQPALGGRIRLVNGDITRPGLDLEDAASFRDEITEIYHLAAVYDLEVPHEIGMKVNVEGTRNLLALAADCPALERFQYVSTCYVSGRHSGAFTESDLDKGQKFNNYYELTKFLAEEEVQKQMAEGLPATIYRPAVVVGDSRSGETQKYDGPYVVIRWLLRQPKVAVMPVVGDTTKHELNVVPSDFVIDAMAYLSGLEASAGKVYQLADPDPPTNDRMLREIARATDRRVVRLKLPMGVAKGAIEYVPFVERIMQIPATSVDYFTHPTHYTSENTQRDLEGSGISCPPFSAYVDNLVRFVREHPDISPKGMA